MRIEKRGIDQFRLFGSGFQKYSLQHSEIGQHLDNGHVTDALGHEYVKHGKD